MNRSEHDLSSRSVNIAHGANTSVLVEVTTHRGTNRRNVTDKMNKSETVPPHLLMQNVQDIRKRLMETEKTLNKISKAEAKLENE